MHEQTTIQAASQDRRSPTEPPTNTRGTRLSILVVDDNPLVVRSLRRMLSRNHDVITASTVPAALDELRNHSFDVVWSDFQIDDEFGTTVLEAALQTHPKAFRILMSGKTEGDIRSTPGLVQRFIPKPFDRQVVRDVLEKLR